MVYPEVADDEDRTSITSQGEISNLVNSMAGQQNQNQQSFDAADEDYVSTQVATGSDQARALAALANELGDPMDMDGTVEIQNPMQVWQQAQNALAATRAAAAAAAAEGAADSEGEDDEGYDHSPTEVVDVKALNFSLPSPGGPSAPAIAEPPVPAPPPQPQRPSPPPSPISRGETYAPTEPQNAMPPAPEHAAGPQFGQPPQDGHGYPATAPNAAVQGQQHDSSSEFDANYGSGQYAPNTPPGGRQTGESWDQGTQNPAGQAQGFGQQQHQQQHAPQFAQQPAQAEQGFGNAGGFNRSPSGLTGAALFDDMPDDEPDQMPPTFVAAQQQQQQQQYTPPPQQHYAPPQQQQQYTPPPEQQQAPQQAAPQGGASAEHPGPWKLKTNFGLTYEFPDTRGLRSWLSSREELDGYTVSADDGGSFHPLDGFPQLDRNAGRTASMSGNMSTGSYGSGLHGDPTGSGQFQAPPPQQQSSASQSGLNAYGSGLHARPNVNPTTGIKGPLVDTEYRPPSRESKYKGLLWLVFLLLVTVAVVIGLEQFGVVSLADMARDLGVLPAESSKSTQTNPIDSNSDNIAADEVDPEALAKKQAAEVERLLADAERLVKGNKLPAAMDMLKTTEQLAPDNPIVHDLKAQVFDKLGKEEDAESSRAKAEQLRTAAEKPADGEAAVADGPDGGAAPEDAE